MITFNHITKEDLWQSGILPATDGFVRYIAWTTVKKPVSDLVSQFRDLAVDQMCEETDTHVGWS